jgi:hypothetical protein
MDINTDRRMNTQTPLALEKFNENESRKFKENSLITKRTCFLKYFPLK